MEYLRKMTSIFHAPIKWKVNYRITILMSHASLYDLYIFDAWIISISGQKRSIVICSRMELYLRTGITGHPVETVASFNSCFSQRRKWTGKRDKTSNQWRGSNSVRIFLKLIFLSHLVKSM